MGDSWQGPLIAALRDGIDDLKSRGAIENWLDIAFAHRRSEEPGGDRELARHRVRRRDRPAVSVAGDYWKAKTANG
jgi:hypothetical protein